MQARIKKVFLAVNRLVFMVVRLSQEMATPSLSKDGASAKSRDERRAKSVEQKAESQEQKQLIEITSILLVRTADERKGFFGEKFEFRCGIEALKRPSELAP